MVTQRQRDEIREHMRRIKNAKDEGKSREEIKRRTRKLHDYLEQEGITNPFDD